MPVLLCRCLVVRAFNQREKARAVFLLSWDAKNLGKCPLEACGLPRLFLVVPIARTRGYRHKPEHVKCNLSIREHLFHCVGD